MVPRDKMERLHPIQYTLLPIALIGLLAGAGCSSGSGQAANPNNGQVLTIGTVNPMSGLSVFSATDAAAQWALKFTLDPLLGNSAPLVFEPKLADSIETEDNRTFTINLNKDAKWSDGEDVTADDVIFTFNLIANPDTKYPSSSGRITTLEGTDDSTGKLISGNEIPDLTKLNDDTVTFKTKESVDPNYVKEIIGSNILILPEHTLADENPATIDTSAWATEGPSVYSGPYKVANYVPSTSVTYEANPDYYLGAPNIKTIIVKVMPAANLAGELSSGSILMNSAGLIGNIPVQDLETVQGFENITVDINPSISFQTMEFNTKNPALADKRVRKALAMAINRQQIVDELLKGAGEIIDGPYTSVNPYLDTNLEPTAYDPDAAKSLLDEAGFDYSTELNLVVPSGNSIREQSADIIQQDLEAIGVNVTTSKYEALTVSSMATEGDFDLLLIGFTLNVDPDVTVLYGGGSTYNYSGWTTERNDELLHEGKFAPSEEDRHEIYNELQALWQDEMPILTLYSNYDVSAVNNALDIHGSNSFWPGFLANIQDWELTGV